MTSRSWSLFAAVSILWGLPYLFIKVAVEELSPAFVTWGRVTIGAAVLLPLAWRSGALSGLRAHRVPLVAFAALEIAVPFAAIAWGERHVTSSVAAILIASLPLVVALLALRFARGERAHGLRLAGLIVGLAGVAMLVGIDIGGRSRELLGAALVLFATVCYAASALVVNRRLADLDPIGAVAVALVLSSLMLAIPAALSAPAAMPSAEISASVVALGLACTALALVLYFALIADVGPGRATVITYINPIVAVALGVIVLGESVGPAAIAGLVLILAGAWLATGGRPRSASISRLRRAERPVVGDDVVGIDNPPAP
jgi:drug/metabolite transporter (DMT)-like permease